MTDREREITRMAESRGLRVAPTTDALKDCEVADGWCHACETVHGQPPGAWIMTSSAEGVWRETVGWVGDRKIVGWAVMVHPDLDALERFLRDEY